MPPDLQRKGVESKNGKKEIVLTKKDLPNTEGLFSLKHRLWRISDYWCGTYPPLTSYFLTNYDLKRTGRFLLPPKVPTPPYGR